MKDRQVKRADGYDKSEKSDKNPVGQDGSTLTLF